MRRILDTLLTGFLTLATPAIADVEWHDHADIARTAEASAARRLPPVSGRRELKAGRIDSRLRLPRCGQALTGDVPKGLARARRVTVAVRCPGPQAWRLHVPVSIAEVAPVVVSVAALQRGDTLKPSDFALEERDIGLLRQGYLTEIDAVVGHRLRRDLAAGQVVTPKLLFADPVIKRGQRVTLMAGAGAMRVRMAGTALADGAEGQRIPVRNLSSLREVEGVVRSYNPDKSMEAGC